MSNTSEMIRKWRFFAIPIVIALALVGAAFVQDASASTAPNARLPLLDLTNGQSGFSRAIGTDSKIEVATDAAGRVPGAGRDFAAVVLDRAARQQVGDTTIRTWFKQGVVLVFLDERPSDIGSVLRGGDTLSDVVNPEIARTADQFLADLSIETQAVLVLGRSAQPSSLVPHVRAGDVLLSMRALRDGQFDQARQVLGERALNAHGLITTPSGIRPFASGRPGPTN